MLVCSVSVQGLSLAGTVTLGSNNSFLYIKTLVVDINLTSVKVSTSGIYVVSNLLVYF